MPVGAVLFADCRRYIVMSTPIRDEDDLEHQLTGTDSNSLSQPEMVFHQLYEMLDQEVARGSSNSRGAIVVMSAVAAAGARDDGGPVSRLAADYTFSHLHQASESLTFSDTHWNVPDPIENDTSLIPVSIDVVDHNEAAKLNSEDPRRQSPKKIPAGFPSTPHPNTQSSCQQKPYSSSPEPSDMEATELCPQVSNFSNTNCETLVEESRSEPESEVKE